ncbi:MAG: response regulator [Deltaproteobacteria bacterium]|nr:response regulator [Deltaproteobacteria bacterium]
MNELNVLIVDDERDYLDTLKKRLEKRGLGITGVENGEDALEWLKCNTADVVLLDVRMTGLDGIQVLREIKKQYPLMEVIMLTGHASSEIAIEGMELGAFDYLMKPVDFDELLYKIQDAYKKRKIQEEKIRGMEKLVQGK